ncbi:MAG: TonB C-terminal domain-containing protein [candidate division KSB1 bacterium]|nr:TonB C-terminal domain-containing protein [candidate division KSB1 bacterium]
MFTQRSYRIALLASLLLHLLLFWGYGNLSKVELPLLVSKKAEEIKPEQEKRLEFEIVETPEEARSLQKPDRANLLSDKNALARDRYEKDDKKSGEPYAQGKSEYKIFDYPSHQETEGIEKEPQASELDKLANSKETKASLSEPSRFTTEEFSREYLLGKNMARIERTRQPVRRLSYENEEFSVENIGGLSFNTYEWNYAPYLLEMKRKIERNIFPPPAFTLMGLISGETLLRFRVTPNGDVQALEVLNYKGHASLMETSVNAIKAAGPFRPLPKDFPEEYLEVTASFLYLIRK